MVVLVRGGHAERHARVVVAELADVVVVVEDQVREAAERRLPALVGRIVRVRVAEDAGAVGLVADIGDVHVDLLVAAPAAVRLGRGPAQRAVLHVERFLRGVGHLVDVVGRRAAREVRQVRLVAALAGRGAREIGPVDDEVGALEGHLVRAPRPLGAEGLVALLVRRRSCEEGALGGGPCRRARGAPRSGHGARRSDARPPGPWRSAPPRPGRAERLPRPG